MSDPMTNVEIEDVLSSIRRLVAEGTPEKPAPQQPTRSMPKLVLTPALRVDATEAVNDAAMGDVDVAGADPATDESVLVLQDHDIVVKSGADDAVDDAPVPSSDRATLLATIADLEAAVRAQSDEWEPDGTGTEIDPGWARAGFRGDVEVEDAEEVAPAPSQTAAWPLTLVEAARRYGDGPVDGIDDDPDPVAEFRHRRHENIARPDEADSDFNDDLIGGPDLGDDPEDALDRYLDGEPVIDEAVLRDMVRDIVRQELQGKLGERITRNVRKLVRREIHRVLTTQNFD